jgi:hypothetical protein
MMFELRVFLYLQFSGVHGHGSTGLVSEGSGVRDVKYHVYYILFGVLRISI